MISVYNTNKKTLFETVLNINKKKLLTCVDHVDKMCQGSFISIFFFAFFPIPNSFAILSHMILSTNFVRKNKIRNEFRSTISNSFHLNRRKHFSTAFSSILQRVIYLNSVVICDMAPDNAIKLHAADIIHCCFSAEKEQA